MTFDDRTRIIVSEYLPIHTAWHVHSFTDDVMYLSALGGNLYDVGSRACPTARSVSHSTAVSGMIPRLLSEVRVSVVCYHDHVLSHIDAEAMYRSLLLGV